MATQYIQKFTSASQLPPDTPNAAAVGVVNGALVFSDTGVSATGDLLGFQTKPDQTLTTTGNVYGVQASPRVETGINANGIIGVSSQPIIKGTGSTVATDVRAYEAAIDLNVAGTPTVTGTVSALYAYLQAPSAGTYTGGAAVIHVPVSDQKPWDYLLFMPTAGQFYNATAPTTLAHSFTVKVGSTLMYIPLYTGVS